MSHDYFSTATALQQHEANVIRNYRRGMAEKYRELAAEADEKALREADVTEQELLTREAATFRWAAVIVDVHEEVPA